MNGGNPIVFSRGIQMSNINGKINKEEYEAIYDGNIGKAIVKKNDGKMYYVEADQNDIKQLIEQPKSDKSIDKKLKNLVDKPLIEKRKRKKRKKRKKKTVRIKTPSRRKHYTVRKKSPSKKKSKKRRTPSRLKSRRKNTRQKISNDPLTVNNIMKTIT
tara:strand:+ start:208 stop:681 length:474 start_codon:yes stop_codon:yes gene_type:complete